MKAITSLMLCGLLLAMSGCAREVEADQPPAEGVTQVEAPALRERLEEVDPTRMEAVELQGGVAQGNAIPPNQNVVPPNQEALPPNQNAIPPTQNNAVPPTQNNAVPPTQNNAVPPTQNNAVPPTQNNAVPPNQNNAVPPNQNNAVPEPRPGNTYRTGRANFLPNDR